MVDGRVSVEISPFSILPCLNTKHLECLYTYIYKHKYMHSCIHTYIHKYIAKCCVEFCDTVLNAWMVALYIVIEENDELNKNFVPTGL